MFMWKLFLLHVYVEFGIIYKFPNWSLIIQHRHEPFLSTYDVI